MPRWERKRKIKIQTARKRARKTALCKTFARIFKYIRDNPGIKLNGVFLNACARRAESNIKQIRLSLLSFLSTAAQLKIISLLKIFRETLII